MQPIFKNFTEVVSQKDVVKDVKHAFVVAKKKKIDEEDPLDITDNSKEPQKDKKEDINL